MENPAVTADQTVAEIAELSPALKAVLARHGVDLCCGGVHPLRLAARAHGADLRLILDELNAAARALR